MRSIRHTAIRLALIIEMENENIEPPETQGRLTLRIVLAASVRLPHVHASKPKGSSWQTATDTRLWHFAEYY